MEISKAVITSVLQPLRRACLTFRRRGPLLAASLAAFWASPHIALADAPRYRVAEVIPFPPGFTEQSQIRYLNINSQGYVLFSYEQDGNAVPRGRPVPLVYKGNGEFVQISHSGLQMDDDSQIYIQYISDVAADGSFRVAGGINNDFESKNRGVIWTVSASGVVGVQTLKNIVVEGGPFAGEQGGAGVTAVNSAGVAVGEGSFGASAYKAVRWFTPDPTAHLFADSDDHFGSTASDIDEAGNYVRFKTTNTVGATNVFYNLTPMPVPAGGFQTVDAVNGDRAIGYYDIGDNKRVPYVYSASAHQVRDLPIYFDPAFGSDQTQFPRRINNGGDITGDTNGVGARPVLWKRQMDGSYQVYPIRHLIADPAATPFLDFENLTNADIAADGSLVVSIPITPDHFFDPQHFFKDRTVVLRPVPPKPGPPLPATTNFTVNDSSVGFAIPPDGVIRLRGKQPSTERDLSVRVQTSTNPSQESSWTDLNNGSSGRMIYDVTNDTYVLNTTSHPRTANLHFRAISAAPGFSASISNVVGPFDLTSSAQHLGRTVVLVRGNGPAAPIFFRAFEETRPAGIAMRVQSSTSPGDESSWRDLNDGNGGKLAPYGAPGQFYLDTDKYPAHGALYFRVVSSAPGYVDSPSRGVGPFNLINSPPPQVEVTSPGRSGTIFGKDMESPVDVSGPFSIGASATDGGAPVTSLALRVDGQAVERFSARTGSRSYTASAGDHVIEATATDQLGVAGYARPVYVRVAPAGGKIYRRFKNGDWNDAGGWLDAQARSGVPGPNDFAVVGSFTVFVEQETTVLAVSLNGGAIDGQGALTVTGTCTIAEGTLPIANLTIASTATMLLVNASDVQIFGTVTNEGTTVLIGRGGLQGLSQSAGAQDGATANDVRPDGLRKALGVFFNKGFMGLGDAYAALFQPDPDPAPEPVIERQIDLSTLANSGTIGALDTGRVGPPLIVLDGPSKILSNDGASLTEDGGVELISNDGSSLIGNDGSSLIGNDGSSLIGNDGSSLLSDSGSGIVAGGAGNFVGGVRGGNFATARTSAASSATEAQDAPATGSGFVQMGGQINLNRITVWDSMTLNGGSLSGTGLIRGDLRNDGGFVAPGNSVGVISVQGRYTQTAAGALVIEVSGSAPSQPVYDRLRVGGTAALDGKLIVKTIGGFTPDPAALLAPIRYSASSGSFASTSGNVQLELTDTGAKAIINGPNPPAPKALNIATRMRVESGDNALIAGFIITGNSPKKVLVRGIGPSLPVSSALADPVLSLDNGAVVNDDWKSTQEQAIRETTIPPSSDLESAIVATLSPGPHTAILRGKNNGTGVGLVEVYDLEGGTPVQLANISTRGLVQAGDNVMIGGFIIGGDYPAKVLLRAIGPSLSVTGKLENPTLELVDANGARITNDDWRATQEAEIIATTVPPTNEKEAAIVATLVPGFYTAIVRGKDDTSGVALVEAYNLQ